MEVPERATTPSGDPIMTAKFLKPAARAPVVPRPRLFERLTGGARGPLTLVSAPAGSGKTVLVSTWATSGEVPGPLVWISLDEEDHQPGVFWSYVLVALAQAGVDTGKMSPPDRNEAVEHSLLVRLAAAISERPEPVVLVLDNAEALTRQQIFDDLDFLLAHSAGRLRLVLVTRVDPNLPLPQFCLARSVTEIRFPELAFTPDEARQLLAGRKPELSDTAVLAFSYRTRGWAAGLRLVGVEDGRGGQVDDAVDFAGTDIALYFRTEVLDAQPPRVRDLLLSTSVVDVLYPELAVLLSGSREAAPTLRELAQASVFVDLVAGGTGRDGGEAYAYHPLVRDLLRAQMRHQSPTRTRRLHRKAARWLAESGRTGEAMRQYAAAEDWEEAAQLLVVEHGVGRLLAAGPGDGLVETFARMPSVTAGPAAAIARAALAVQQGDLIAGDKQLARAGELVTDVAAPETALPLAVAVTRMIRAAVGGEAQEALSGAALVQSLVAGSGAPSDPEVAALASLASARGGFLLGELPFAREMFRSAVGAVPAQRSPVLRTYALAQLALVEASSGALAAAGEAAEEALAGSGSGPTPGGDTAPMGTSAAHVALAWVAADRGELAAAGEHVRAAQAEGSGGVDPVTGAALVLVRTRLLRLAGHAPAALRLFRHWSDRSSASTPSWLSHRLEAAEARVLLEEGRTDEAEALLRRSVNQGSLECLLTHGWIKLAADGATESWRTARQALRESGTSVELLVEANLLSAASALALSRSDAAALAVDEALRLASAEGLRRPLDEAPLRVRALIDQRRHHPQPEPPAPSPSLPPLPRPRQDASAGARGTTALGTEEADVIIQPLTKREAEVLAYLDQLLPTEEIAARMFLSVNTIKTHVRAILRKLSAERRNEAVRRARELGLL